MSALLKILFFALVVRPIVFIGLGLNILGRQNLPGRGPAVVAANHNSHLDAIVLMSLFPLARLPKVRPVAAADYFLKNRLLGWFALNVIGIIPLDRTGQASREELFAECHRALDKGAVLILFPEGSRGEPEKLSRLRKGLYHLVKERDDTPIIPAVMHGLGRSLPKGEGLLVPFNCDVVIGEPLELDEISGKSGTAFTNLLSSRFNSLFEHCITRSRSLPDDEDSDVNE